MHVSPAKHSYAWIPRKCNYRTDRHTDEWTDARQSDSYMLPCFAAGDTKIYFRSLTRVVREIHALPVMISAHLARNLSPFLVTAAAAASSSIGYLYIIWQNIMDLLIGITVLNVDGSVSVATHICDFKNIHKISISLQKYVYFQMCNNIWDFEVKLLFLCCIINNMGIIFWKSNSLLLISWFRML